MGTGRLANLHVMGDCVNCGGALEDRWKFCIFCGTPVSKAPISEPVATPDVEPAAAPEPEPARPPIPSAIRTFVPVEIPNEDDDEPSSRQIRPRLRPRHVDIPLLLGITLGVAGFSLIVYMIAVLSGQG